MMSLTRRVALTLGSAAVLAGAGGGVAAADPGPAPTCAQKLAADLAAEFPTVTVGADAVPTSILPEHVDGRALDVMIPDYQNPDQITLGNNVVARVHALAADGRYPVEYTVWRQEYAVPGQPAQRMEDRGSATQNHDDHVHITLREVTC